MIQILAAVVCHSENKHSVTYQNGLFGAKDAKHQVGHDNCKHKNTSLIKSLECLIFACLPDPSIFQAPMGRLKYGTNTVLFSILTLNSCSFIFIGTVFHL
jgi:hypothetical protein